MVFEWTLGLIIPVLVAGPICECRRIGGPTVQLLTNIPPDYVSQNARFEVVEGLGCTNTWANSLLSLISINFWVVAPPLSSLALYHSEFDDLLLCKLNGNLCLAQQE